MGLKKESNNTIQQSSNIGEVAQSAIDRLSQTNEPKTIAKKKMTYEQRDFAKEALGKTRCVQWEAALMSPAIAGMRFTTMEEYLVLVKQAADAGVAYSFQD